ncbi:hypothetical protein JR316_0005557 [Psilocybe cubensis]|uniref:Uncharacterized protein n=2 Tax=Psilocybe cubensis TaxID=181762 RepID=A0A8H8CM89_PSICU|nr:hypothetical protein JR316_0005557 [Psilocybe cubensis]KAH9481038.1 hypothetical protein JR316_0005557 [Psilocybe cubensis]
MPTDGPGMTLKAFRREALFDSRWYLRSKRIVVYQATVLISMAAQGAGTYCMFKHRDFANHIHSFSMNIANVHNIDIRATTILSMIFPAMLSLDLNAAYYSLVFYPGKNFPLFNKIVAWLTVFITIGMTATTLAGTVIVASRSASISGVDAATAQQLTELYFRPPLKYREWGQNIAWIVLMWITLALNFASVVLMRQASLHDSKNGSNLISTADHEPEFDSGMEGSTGEKDKTDKVIEEKVLPVV